MSDKVAKAYIAVWCVVTLAAYGYYTVRGFQEGWRWGEFVASYLFVTFIAPGAFFEGLLVWVVVGVLLEKFMESKLRAPVLSALSVIASTLAQAIFWAIIGAFFDN